ncbi:MAG: phage tail sheath subtilisin-like domain-containing protein [Actinomycetota bacterium]|nr:phage tail sheath subtilisin-like domain-containing protein [Actinomycetota bacterium]
MTTYLTPGVYVEEVESGSKPIEGVSTSVAAFVGFTANAPADNPSGLAPRLVTSWGDYTRLYGGFVEGAMLPHSVYGYFANGGGSCYIVRIPHAGDGDTSPRLALPSATKDELETLRVRALEGAGPYEVVIEPADASSSEGGGGGAAGTFTLKVRTGGRDVETFPDLTFARGARNVETVVNRESTMIRVEAPAAQGVSAVDRVPPAGTHRLEPVAADSSKVGSSEFRGDESARSGIGGLVIADEVTMVAVPDLITAATTNGSVDLGLFKDVQTTLIDHCEKSANRMAILDAPPGMSPQQVKEWRTDTAMYDAKFAAFYYPWLEVSNPLGDRGSDGSATLTIPPCGHVAGIWARNDATRGVWKAPANEVVRGALNVETKVTSREQELLNPNGINCIRPFGTRGIRVWGARTLSSDASWRYVNVRRLFTYIEESILRGTQWIVFEPNDLDLWQRVKRTINAFLLGLWRQGALLGATPEQAFYVKCDAETNPSESIDEGRLTVEIGIAPVKPAEFVIFRISQWQGGASTAE